MKRFFVLFAFLFALAIPGAAQSLCTITGTLYDSTGAACNGCRLTISRARSGSTPLSQGSQPVVANGSGVVSFTAVQGSFITLTGPFTIGRYNLSGGLEFYVPLQSSATLATLQTAEDALNALISSTTYAPADIPVITKIASASLSNEFALGSLATGLLKNTTTTGVPTIAVAGTDYLPAINGLTEDASPDSANDFVVTYDASAAAHKKVKLANLPGGGGGAVSSVFGRTGAVTAATNDYTWAQIDKTTSSLADITTRSASDLSSGTLAAARGGAGTVSGILKADGAGLVSAASAGTDYEVPLTFSTGLTRSTNTITVNTSQNIATLSNLTSNGLVTTSGGAGTLGVTVPGTGVLTALAVNIGSAGAPVLFDGAGGTPSSLTCTNCTGLPLSTGVTGDLPFANFVQAGSAGFVGATGAGDYSHRTPAQVTAALDAFVGDSGSGGTKGLVPAPTTGDSSKYLKGDGTWASVSAAPGGSPTELQRNNAGALGGISGATSDGTNVTFGSGNLRATSPRFTTDISDSNGNEIFKITATGSAVNEITVANAATGGNPTLSATGGDTNVGIAFATKGTGKVQVTPGTGGSSTLQVNHSDGTPLFQIGGFSSTPTAATLYMGNITPSTTNYTLLDFTDLYVNARAGGAVLIRSNNVAIASFTTTNGLAIGSSIDAGLTRLASGVLRATNGSTGAGSLVLGTSTVGSIGTSGVGVLAIANGTAPSSRPADEFQFYAADYVAGDSRANILSEANATPVTIGNHSVLTGYQHLTKTADYTVVTADSNAFFDNVGAGAGVVFTLPTPTASPSLKYTFCRVANQTVTVDIGGSVTIRSGANVTTSGGNVTLDAVGSCLTILSVSSTEWYASAQNGTLTFN